MSADNYLAVRHNKKMSEEKPWFVVMGNASTGHETIESDHATRDDAITAAVTLNHTQPVEYGISVIEPEPEVGDES